ncbi:unnamed protein product [Urochloa humidicola]
MRMGASPWRRAGSSSATRAPLLHWACRPPLPPSALAAACAAVEAQLAPPAGPPVGDGDDWMKIFFLVFSAIRKSHRPTTALAAAGSVPVPHPTAAPPAGEGGRRQHLTVRGAQQATIASTDGTRIPTQGKNKEERRQRTHHCRRPQSVTTEYVLALASTVLQVHHQD